MSDPRPDSPLPLLVASGLVKRYAGASRPALDGVSLSVAEGEVLGLLGPNGAGKTTAIGILSTLLPASAGEASIGGLDVYRDAARVRHLIGVVPQDIAVYPSLTGRENLVFFGRLCGLRGAGLRQRVDEGLAAMGLAAQADRLAATYSGGMKRRLNLAVGLLHRPRLLFLDEPTVGIDAQSRAMVLQYLADLRQAGMTMVYTTHYMEEAQQLCSTIAILDLGRIVAQGTCATLLQAHPACASLGELFLHLTGRQLRD